MNSIEDRKKELRKFGLLVGSILICLGILPLFKGNGLVYYSIIPGGVLCMLGVFLPLFLSPVYAVWMKIGHVLGRINSLIILALIYYLVFVPMRLLRVLFSKDRKFAFRTGAISYWIRRFPEDFGETMKRQF